MLAQHFMGSPDRFLKEMFSYIDLPFGEWVQNYGDFVLDASGYMNKVEFLE